MAVPKQRKTKSRRNNRRSHHALKKKSLTACKKCGELKMPHRVCQNCGTYKGREYIDITRKMTRREKKRKEKELEEQEKSGPLNMEDLSKK
ncbi:MAG: 50S ribosomal protein L32 [Candidatus Spechtbacterales bacterium]|nr:50S ribosomal protein L32 [Candidatus Spechtbacterales bacterium]